MNLSLIFKIIGILLLIYCLIVFYVYLKQRSLLYIPNIDNYDDEALTIDAQEVFITNSNEMNEMTTTNSTEQTYS